MIVKSRTQSLPLAKTGSAPDKPCLWWEITANIPIESLRSERCKCLSSSCITDCSSFPCPVLLWHIECFLENTTLQLRKKDQLHFLQKRSLLMRTGIQRMLQMGKLVAGIFSVFRWRVKTKLPESTHLELRQLKSMFRTSCYSVQFVPSPSRQYKAINNINF